MKQVTTLASAVIIALFVFILWRMTAVPVVEWSTAEDKCVRVVGGEQHNSCADLPAKYEKVWVR